MLWGPARAWRDAVGSTADMPEYVVKIKGGNAAHPSETTFTVSANSDEEARRKAWEKNTFPREQVYEISVERLN